MLKQHVDKLSPEMFGKIMAQSAKMVPAVLDTDLVGTEVPPELKCLVLTDLADRIQDVACKYWSPSRSSTD